MKEKESIEVVIKESNNDHFYRDGSINHEKASKKSSARPLQQRTKDHLLLKSQQFTLQTSLRPELTHERTHALKLLSNQEALKTRDCFSPEHAALSVNANELGSLDKSNPFRFWEDRDRRTKTKESNIPKRFFTNYKLAAIRDARLIARALSDNSKVSHVCTQDCDCGKLYRGRRFRIRSPRQFGRKKVDVNRLHNPYKPCRKTCSCNHNPKFHAARMQKEHVQRLQASATRLMVLSVLPKRPGSADSAGRRMQE